MQTSLMSPRMRFAASYHQDRFSNTKLTRKSSELVDSQFSAPQNEASKGDGSMQQRKEVMVMDSAAASVHPAREDELGYDSSSSFEFHTRERSQPPSRTRYLTTSRPIMPSKWNDAEKWILNKKHVQLIRISKKTNAQNCGAPEFETAMKACVKRADFSRLGKSEFGSFRAEPVSGQGDGGGGNGNGNGVMIEVAGAGIPATMRDMGTEMTPVPSQEPSRSPTPVGATTPLRSPATTPPSSPLRQVLSLVRTEDEAGDLCKDGEKELSEQEMKRKITREIASLGVHLGKLNIVAWARKGERERNKSAGAGAGADADEYRNRAAAWEEAEKSKHEARFKREEIRIQAWESRQKTKIETRTRRMEVRMEQMRRRAEAKLLMKMASARAAADVTKARQLRKTAAQAHYIRQTGRIPSAFFNCWWWSRRSYL